MKLVARGSTFKVVVAMSSIELYLQVTMVMNAVIITLIGDFMTALATSISHVLNKEYVLHSETNDSWAIEACSFIIHLS